MKSKGIFDRIIDFMAFLAGILLVVAVLIVCWEIAMRYFVHQPLVWMVEVCEYILFSMAFLAAPWLLKKGGHVSVDVVTEHLSQRMQRYMKRTAMAAGVIVSGIISCFSFVTALECYRTGVLVTKTINVPKHYFLFLICLGYLFLLFEFARQFVHGLRRTGEED
jgi:TRAP-type C4-dicarboxylate transport system permease small subunit